jgi:hypothetical protein
MSADKPDDDKITAMVAAMRERVLAWRPNMSSRDALMASIAGDSVAADLAALLVKSFPQMTPDDRRRALEIVMSEKVEDILLERSMELFQFIHDSFKDFEGGVECVVQIAAEKIARLHPELAGVAELVADLLYSQVALTKRGFGKLFQGGIHTIDRTN